MLTEPHIKRLATFFLICCFANQLWFVYHGLTLFQYNPVFFSNKLDLTGNLFMSTGIYKPLMSSPLLRLIIDAGFLLLPALLLLSVKNEYRIAPLVAIFTGVYNIFYAWLMSVFTWVSIEVYSAFIFFPLVFAANGMLTRFYLLHIVRYIFILIFFSTAWWKWRTGSIFNSEQFSAILQQQQASFLATDPTGWYADFIRFLIAHPTFSYIAYLLVFAGELFFAVGFFTRRFDKLLVFLFISFVLLDYLVMEINYFTWFPFLGCLWYAHLKKTGTGKTSF